ncbi:hypothetical protein ACWGE0_35355 [Lentzea sp. NPDC054927]
MDLILDPPHSGGSVRIGMPFDEAIQVVQAIEGFQLQAPAGGYTSPGFAHFDSGMSISLGPDRNGAVKAVEVYRPDRDVDVTYRDIDVFSRPADEVIRLLAEIADVRVEDDGLLVVAPDLLLSLSRDMLPEDEDDEDGRYFGAVLVAAPGYYD